MGQPFADPELKVDFDKTPFWKALDEVLDQAGLGVYAFGQQRGINVVTRGRGQLPRRPRQLQRPVPLRAGPHLRQPRSSASAAAGADAGGRGGLGTAAAAHRLEAAHGRHHRPGRNRPAPGRRRSQGRGRTIGAEATPRRSSSICPWPCRRGGSTKSPASRARSRPWCRERSRPSASPICWPPRTWKNASPASP